MIALDTNLLARLLLQDDAVQHKKVKALFAGNEVFTAPVTVLLELVWVLESKGLSAGQISTGVAALLKLPNFKPERKEALQQTLLAYDAGMDFADALHWALSDSDEKFLTFDKTFARQSKKLKLKPSVTLA